MFISPRTIRSPCGPEIVKICLKASSQTKTKPSLFHLFLLAGSEIVLNVEGFPDFLGGLPLDHVGNSLAGNIQQTLGQRNVKY